VIVRVVPDPVVVELDAGDLAGRHAHCLAGRLVALAVDVAEVPRVAV
jgi:hypothetical protein